ncbi:MAG: ABC transporter permease [Firmicutes bacterium]|nr:ABC transporter permease [Bacillota bacterium]
MKKRVRSRLFEYIITLIIIITLNFLLPRLMPGDPFLYLSSEQGQDVMYSEEQRQHYLDYYGLNKAIFEQYLSYLGKLIQGNLGYSLYYNEPVINIIWRRLIWTFFLVIAAVCISTLSGMVLGSISAWYKDIWVDKWLFFNLIFLSEIPSFLLGLILLFVFAADLNLFPLSGAMSHFVDYNNPWERFLDIIYHAVLPLTALSIARLGGSYLLARNSVLSVLGKDFIRTARAKGLSKIRIISNYVLRNALLPVLTRVFLSLGSLVGGAILVENVFKYPGLGHLMREAVMVRDYPLIQGIFLLVAIFVLTANYLADFLYQVIDPRLVLEEKKQEQK